MNTTTKQTDSPRVSPKVRRAVGRLLVAVEKQIAAAEEARRARDALLQFSRPRDRRQVAGGEQ